MASKDIVLILLQEDYSTITALNPKLEAGQEVLVTGIPDVINEARKLGDGISHFNDLPFIDVLRLSVSADYSIDQAYLKIDKNEVEITNSGSTDITLTISATESVTLYAGDTDRYRYVSSSWVQVKMVVDFPNSSLTLNNLTVNNDTVLNNLEVQGDTSLQNTIVHGSFSVDGTEAFDVNWHNVGASGEPAFQNSWVNYGTYNPARFRRSADGFVQVEGMVKDGSGVIFTLPEHYRPDFRILGDAISNSAQGRVDIHTNGNVEMITGNNAWVSFRLMYYVSDGYPTVGAPGANGTVWNPNDPFPVDAIVGHNKQMWIAINQNQNSEPSASNADWEIYSGRVYISTLEPTSGDGLDGDIWYIY